MGREVDKLSARGVAALRKAGRHSDGGGLYLSVSETGARSWLFMWKICGRRREMGLGSLRDTPLAKARSLAGEARRCVREGKDPISARERTGIMTFGEASDALIASMSASWRNSKHKAQWEMTLSHYCGAIRGKQVDRVATDDILLVLQPIWQAKAETAARLRGRIERVLDFAKARGMRQGENPARWRGHLDAILPRRAKLTRGHHRALPFADLPSFMVRLEAMTGVSPRAFEFLILTAARTGEVLGARWQEIDLEAAVWTVPGSRMKGGRPHRVPLVPSALAVLKVVSEARVSDYVFPGAKPGMPLSSMALEMVLRRAGVNTTVHGFRSSFRDWAGECTHFPREIAEAALAHLVGDDTERAYRRGDALQKRRLLMMAWEQYLQGHPISAAEDADLK